MFDEFAPPPLINRWHLIPNGDLREHESSVFCWCKPVESADTPDVFLHNSMDRREEYEEGRRQS